MNSSVVDQKAQAQTVTVEDVNRLLDLGRLLFSVLTPEEIGALQSEFSMCSIHKKLGNAGDS
ncbi:MAG: hypothetical protein ISR58_21595 [Anaerolineales bacterium]|nr:hypothetical protein [Chloroflexota bacterium]MBL6983786.1 hypothetical protein [Anaerolineales bacterium]